MTAEGYSKVQAEDIGQLNAGASKIRNKKCHYLFPPTIFMTLKGHG
jgi:hypothetical protein